MSIKVDYVKSDQFSVYISFDQKIQKLTPKATIELRNKLDNIIKKYDSTKIHPCNWCGKGTGKIVVKDYHEECHEAILNGEGMC